MHANRHPFDDLGVFALIATALALTPLGHDAAKRGIPAGEATPEGVAPAPRGLFARIDHWFWKQEERARDSYLAQASDLCDLEARIRDLERGVPAFP